MATKRNRLKAWPLWASNEYQAALVAVRRLRMDSQEGLWRIRNGNSGKITRLLRRLPQYARDANLAGLTALALKREHQEERWPRHGFIIKLRTVSKKSQNMQDHQKNHQEQPESFGCWPLEIPV